MLTPHYLFKGWVKLFPPGHAKAGQPMRFKAKCAACAAIPEDQRTVGMKPIFVQHAIDETWLERQADGVVRAMRAAFPRLRFPVLCPLHERRRNLVGSPDSTITRSVPQSYAGDPNYFSRNGSERVTDAWRYGSKD